MKKGCNIKCCLLLLILILGIFAGMVIADRYSFSIPNSYVMIILLLLGVFSASLIFFMCCVDSNDCEKSKYEVSQNTKTMENVIQEAIATGFAVISEKMGMYTMQTNMNPYIPKDENEEELFALFYLMWHNKNSKNIDMDKLIKILEILAGCNDSKEKSDDNK